MLQIPDWITGPDDLSVCMLIPLDFANQVSSWPRIALPSPWAPGPFGTPKWFKAHIADQVKQQMEASLWQAALEPHPSFDFSMQGQLLQDLRGVVCGDIQTSQLLPWVIKFQKSDDALHATRRDAGMDDMIEFSLLAESLKNSDLLKKTIVRSCKIILPENIFNTLSPVLNAKRVPLQSEISRFRLTLDSAMMLQSRCCHLKGFLLRRPACSD